MLRAECLALKSWKKLDSANSRIAIFGFGLYTS